MPRRIIFAISDLQIPFEHRDAFDFVCHVVRTTIRPDDVVTFVNQGDEVDLHGLGKYPANPDGYSAGDEIRIAKERLKPWYQAFPHMSVCTSNHTWRGYKKAFDIGIPEVFLRNIGEVLEAPRGWQWKDRWIYENICFEHGENVSGTDAALKAAIQNRMSTSIGHQHSHAGVIYSGSFHDSIWGMNTGCLIDVDKYAFAYGNKLRKKPTLGMGVIIDGTPLFIPMVLNASKRWIGRTI